MDILIVKLGALGDVINTFPLVRLIRNHFHGTITWLVAPLSYPLVSRHPSVDHTIVFDKTDWTSSLVKVVTRLRSQHFDLALDLQRTLKSASFCMLAKSERRIGFDRKRCKEMSWLFPFERIKASDPNAHMLNQYLGFADYLDIPADDIRWEILSPGTYQAMLPENYIVLNIGATKPANRWTDEGFAALARAIKDRYDLTPVLTGGKEDIDMADRITNAAGNTAVNLVGRTSIDELVDILQYSIAVVTCDTGPMHLAVALGKDVIALFGPSDANRTGPFHGKVIAKPHHCSPCNKKRCKDPLCMRLISHDDVIKELDEITHVKG